jgi:uncharacterized membrane protein YecN with MAPEG domain
MAPVTTIYAALLGLLYLTLAYLVVRARDKHSVTLGEGPAGELVQPIRVHANLVEYAPIFLILLLLAELGSSPAWLLHGAGTVFVIGRVLHAMGLTRSAGATFGRYWGTVLTWLMILCLSLYLLVRSFLA